MDTSRKVLTQTWLTQKPRFVAWPVLLILTLFTLSLSLLTWIGPFTERDLLSASRESVFHLHQFYRLWTTLFVHADTGHLFSNLVLFIPLVYLLAAYFGTWGWPLGAIIAGGFINALVLQGMAPTIFLVGISGVVNFMGAAWLTLYYLIDLRERRRRQFAVVLFISFILFVPDTYKPEVSYASHLVGYLFGILAGVTYFLINRSGFKAEEVFEIVHDEPSVSTEIVEAPSSHIDMSNF